MLLCIPFDPKNNEILEFATLIWNTLYTIFRRGLSGVRSACKAGLTWLSVPIGYSSDGELLDY